MDRSTFFQQFEKLSETPNAIPKMREFVLQLAVQGRLVPQDPKDEPAERALRSCGVDIERWAAAEDEERHAVPDSWTWIRFGGVGEQRLGKMLDAQKNRGESKPYLRNTNVQWMHFELDDVKEMRVEKSEEDELQLKHEDLLICEGGEPGRCAIWRDEVPEMYFQKALHRVRPCDAILSEFLALNLQIDCRNDVLARYFTGATIKHLTGRSLNAYPVPVPPLAEQKRIVAKVDELMTLCDELETRQQARQEARTRLQQSALHHLVEAREPQAFVTHWHRVRDNFHLLHETPESVAELRKTILQLAVQGRLVSQDSKDEVASRLADQIRVRKNDLIKQGVIKRAEELPPISEDEPPFALPKSWSWIRLADLCELITKGSSPKWQGVNYAKSDQGILFITSENVRNFVMDLSQPKYVERKFNEIEPRSILRRDDILMNIVGASIGRTAIFERNDAANINQAVCLIRIVGGHELIFLRYLLIFFNSSYCIDLMFDKQVENARANLSMGNIAKFPVPVPPLTEQKRIVAKVDELMRLCDELENKLAQCDTIGEKLVESTVQHLLAS